MTRDEIALDRVRRHGFDSEQRMMRKISNTRWMGWCHGRAINRYKKFMAQILKEENDIIDRIERKRKNREKNARISARKNEKKNGRYNR